MSNAPGPRRRRRGGLELPRSVWPTMVQAGATPGIDETQVEQAVKAASERLASRLAGARRRTEIRVVVVDADEADAVFADLNLTDQADPDLLAFCAEHPGGRLVLAWANYQPDTRRTTIL